MPDTYDVCVIGGGPAGLAAATWLGRYRRSAVVVDSGEYRNRWTERIHGYLGLDPIAPSELLSAARRHLDQYENIEVVSDRISSVQMTPPGFVSTGRRRAYRSRRLILATGVVDSFPHIDGFEEHYGADVFHCPLCDGFEAREKRVVVLGFSNEAAHFAAGLLNWAASVTLVEMGEQAKGDKEYLAPWRKRGLTVVEGIPASFVGRRGALKGVTLSSGETVDCEVAFFSTGNYPKSALAEQLGCRFTEEDCLQVDHEGLTSVEGVFAAGDLTPGSQLVQVAAADGAVAGIHCARSLLIV